MLCNCGFSFFPTWEWEVDEQVSRQHALQPCSSGIILDGATKLTSKSRGNMLCNPAIFGSLYARSNKKNGLVHWGTRPLRECCFCIATQDGQQPRGEVLADTAVASMAMS